MGYSRVSKTQGKHERYNMNLLHLPVVPPLILILGSIFWTTDLAGAETDKDQIVEKTPWTHHLKTGLYFNSVSSTKSTASNDPTISGTSASASYTMTIDARLKWEEGVNSFQNDLILKYGKTYEKVNKWIENTDEIDYDGIYRRDINGPHNAYASIGLDSVFTGVEPEGEALDPIIGKVAVGYTYKRDNIFPETDSFEGRVGARAQRAWGDNATAQQKETETGIEVILRYERTKNKQLDYFVQYEFFSEFEELSHNTHLIIAGINYKISPVFSIRFDVRGYYETKPDGAVDVVDKYNTLALRQETMVGFTYEF